MAAFLGVGGSPERSRTIGVGGGARGLISRPRVSGEGLDFLILAMSGFMVVDELVIIDYRLFILEVLQYDECR